MTTTSEPKVPPVLGLVVETEAGLGMVVKTGEEVHVQIFREGQIWRPLQPAPEPPKDPHRP